MFLSFLINPPDLGIISYQAHEVPTCSPKGRVRAEASTVKPRVASAARPATEGHEGETFAPLVSSISHEKEGTKNRTPESLKYFRFRLPITLRTKQFH